MWPFRPIPSVENDRISILSISTFHTKVSKTSVFTMFAQRFQEKALFHFKPSESIFSRIMYSWYRNIIFLEYYELTNGNCSSANWSMAIDQWPLINGHWSMAMDQWPLINGQKGPVWGPRGRWSAVNINKIYVFGTRDGCGGCDGCDGFHGSGVKNDGSDPTSYACRGPG